MGASLDQLGLEGATLDGRYEVRQVIARGGFGTVYRGLQRDLDRPVAIKILRFPKHLGPEDYHGHLDSFRREAMIIARLSHPAVVKVHDFGISALPDGKQVPWMVMDWVEGESLTQYLQRRPGFGMAPSECLALLKPVFEALAEAHEQGIAHRDLKPGNLMVDPERLESTALTGRRGAPAVRLLDFGIAKVMNPDESPTPTGETHTVSADRVAFSEDYAAPEQLARTRTGPWTDVHALGLILTRMVTGELPYRGLRGEDLHQVVFSPERPSPARFHIDVGAWEPVLVRALAVKPVQRHPNARALLAALEEVLPTIAPVPLEGPPREASASSVAGTLDPHERASSNTNPRPSAPRSFGWILPSLGAGVLVAGLTGVAIGGLAARRGGAPSNHGETPQRAPQTLAAPLEEPDAGLQRVLVPGFSVSAEDPVGDAGALSLTDVGATARRAPVRSRVVRSRTRGRSPADDRIPAE
ncbi:MAG: serine/threonine protein kinase [Deltaproteobacteria bacterium]|nr:serine/threonine protein kinase [Deltaproteobacteria bacterium]